METIRQKNKQFKRASGMLIVFFILTIFTIVAGFSFYQVSSDINLNSRYVFEEKAFWLAESGVSFAEYALRNDDWSDWTQQSGDWYYSRTTSGGDFDVYVVKDPVSDIGTISAFGYIPSKAAANKYVKNIIVDFGSRDAIKFKYAMFSRNNLLIKNDVIIDSYNSEDGAYGGANVKQNGSVGAQASNITLQNNVIVYGDIYGLENTTIKKLQNAQHVGEEKLLEEIPMDSQEVPEDLAAVVSAGTLDLGETDILELNTGNYAYSKINLDSDAKIVINGDVALRIDNSLNLNDNANVIVNGTLTIYTSNGVSMDDNSFVKSSRDDGNPKPSDIIVFGPSNNASSDFSGNSKFYGVMYAPDGQISFNDQAELYGAVAARVASFSQEAQLHYDEVLGDLGVGAQAYNRTSWREV